MTGDGTDRPRDGELEVPPNQAELLEVRSGGKATGAATVARAGCAPRGFFGQLLAPLDAVSGWRLEEQELRGVAVVLPSGGVAGKAWAGDDSKGEEGLSGLRERETVFLGEREMSYGFLFFNIIKNKFYLFIKKIKIKLCYKIYYY